MKGLAKIFVIAITLLFAVQIQAGNNTNKMNKNNNAKKLWVCETNATSSSNPHDQKADDTMSKKAKPAKEQFGFALQNCRDCTKITCTTQTNQ